MAEENSTPAVATVPADLVRERDEYRRKAEAAELQLKAAAKGSDEAKALLAQLQERVSLTEKEREKALATARETQKSAVIREVALKAGVVDVDIVSKLVADQLAVAEDGAIVSASDPKISAEAAITAYLTKNPFLVAAKIARGSGSSPVAFAAPPSTPIPTDPHTAEGRDAIVRKTIAGLFAKRK